LIKLSQDRDKWWAVANKVINNRFRIRRGISRVGENIIRPSTESDKTTDNMQGIRENPNKAMVTVLKLRKILNRWK
jgi:hypothetical protein